MATERLTSLGAVIGGAILGSGAILLIRGTGSGWLVLVAGVALMLACIAPYVVKDIRLGREIKRMEQQP